MRAVVKSRLKIKDVFGGAAHGGQHPRLCLTLAGCVQSRADAFETGAFIIAALKPGGGRKLKTDPCQM